MQEKPRLCMYSGLYNTESNSEARKGLKTFKTHSNTKSCNLSNVLLYSPILILTPSNLQDAEIADNTKQRLTTLTGVLACRLCG